MSDPFLLRLMILLENISGHHSIPIFVLRVDQDENQVESGEKRARDGHVHAHRMVGVELALSKENQDCRETAVKVDYFPFPTDLPFHIIVTTLETRN